MEAKTQIAAQPQVSGAVASTRSLVKFCLATTLRVLLGFGRLSFSALVGTD